MGQKLLSRAKLVCGEAENVEVANIRGCAIVKSSNALSIGDHNYGGQERMKGALLTFLRPTSLGMGRCLRDTFDLYDS